jgi:putative glycosyltransferase (TIGR04372 family)
MFIRKLLVNSFYFLISPLIILIVIAKPLIHLKFCQIYSRRFGDFLDRIAGYLSYKDLKNEFKNCKTIFFWDYIVSNKQLKKMAEREMTIFPLRFLILPIYKALIFFKQTQHILDLENYIFSESEFLIEKKIFPNLIFTKSEEKEGLNQIKKLNFKLNDSWACVHNRDTLYLETIMPKDYPKNIGSWNYQNHRDFSINDTKDGLENLSSSGINILRMGSIAKEQLNTSEKKIIDYANSDLRNDFLDVFLLAKADFLISGDSGMTVFPMVFNKPLYGINISSTQLHDPRFLRYTMLMFKRIKNLNTGKLLSLKEILNSEFAYTSNAYDFSRNNVIPVSNTSKEIMFLTNEIIDLKKNKEIFKDIDYIKAKKEFWEIYKKNVKKDKKNSFFPILSPSFLKNNLDLLN